MLSNKKTFGAFAYFLGVFWARICTYALQSVIVNDIVIYSASLEITSLNEQTSLCKKRYCSEWRN